MAESVLLYSPISALHVPLVPPEEAEDPRTGKRVSRPGIKVKFVSGRARVSPEVWALLREAPCYTGIGSRKSVFTEEEATSIPTSSGPQIVHGALGTKSAPGQPPSADWNSTGVVALSKRIAAGEFADILDAALAYEMGNKRRKTVVRAITDALLESGPVKEPAQESDEDDTLPAALTIEPDEPPTAELPEGSGF